jgi:hypothetical protein
MKKLFQRITLMLKALFTNIDEWIDEHVQPSIQVVEYIKTLVDNPLADVATALIPGQLDDFLLAFARRNLARAVQVLQITNTIASEPDPVRQLQLLFDYLNNISPELRKGIYYRLASVMAKLNSGSKKVIKGKNIDLLVALQVAKTINDKPKEPFNYDIK